MSTNTPPPPVTAKSWVVFTAENNQFFFGKRENVQREVASLTKIMTFYTSLNLIKELKIDPKTTYISISETASNTNGTSA